MPDSHASDSQTIAEIIRVVDAIDRAVDGKDWAVVRSHFADRLTADFSTLSGQPAADIPSDALVQAWATNLTAAKTSFHMRTNHQVTLAGDVAEVESAGYAWNRMEGNGDPLWEVWGTYRHHLFRTSDGWKVDAMTLIVAHQRGNSWVRDTVPAA
ncbi:MAG: nuclear transport factor 2 family protein [Pseudomonadota bacterium]|uniref:nuclear transport factor 2 family protein n=1 Tax=Sphingomonas sp. ERG5 TaxID=1381597 RepID=UPI00068FD2B5|nr:nuclear transport factor 2 family protein [Sphingomonas sp. ERG5]